MNYSIGFNQNGKYKVKVFKLKVNAIKFAKKIKAKRIYNHNTKRFYAVKYIKVRKPKRSMNPFPFPRF